MSNPIQYKEVQQEIGFKELFLFLKKNQKSLVFFAVISTLIVSFLVIAGYFLLPRKEMYSIKLSIQLQKKNGTFIYPSEKIFSANDILSTVVLRKVYEKNNLSKRLTFENFSKLFYLEGINEEKGKLTALYQAKLSKRNITLVDIKNLETEYEDALKKLEHQFVSIVMIPTFRINSPQEIAQILRDIPIIWFDIYSKLEAKALPRIENAVQVRKLQMDLATDGWLITLDRARLICAQLLEGCKEFDQILMGQHATLPTGESLENLQFRLQDLDIHRIRPLLLIALANSSKTKGSLNEIFLRSNIIALDRKISVLKEKYEGASEAINILNQNNKPSRNKMSALHGGEQEAPLTVNLDGKFFDSLTSLIRNAENMELRTKYANESFEIKKDFAELKAEKNYYETLLQMLEQQKPDEKQLAEKQLEGLGKKIFDELILLCGKINDFRIMILKDFISSRLFFATSGEIQKIICFPLPFKYITVLLIFFLIAVNGIYIGSRFYISLHINKQLRQFQKS